MKRVLIVEDNAAHMFLSAHLLRKNGFQVIEATNAADGVALARSDRPDIVLMDLRMPGEDGYSAIRRLRADPATADIKIIAISSLQDPLGSSARPPGADAFLEKPFHYGRFLELIGTLLGR